MVDEELFEDTPFEETAQDVKLTPEETGRLEALANAPEVDQEIAVEDVLPKEPVFEDPLQAILYGINNFRLLQMLYVNRRQEMKYYTIEPYEIGGNKSHPAGYLWGWDINVDTIKSFFLSNIQEIQVLSQTFVARF